MRGVFAFLFSLLVLSMPSYAQDSAYDAVVAKGQAQAQKDIDACWAISDEDLSSGITPAMTEGTRNSIKCMQERINFLNKTVLFKNQPKTQAESEKALQETLNNLETFYGDLFTGHDSCVKEPCGTMYTTYPYAEMGKVLEFGLRNVYQQLIEFDSTYHYISGLKP